MKSSYNNVSGVFRPRPFRSGQVGERQQLVDAIHWMTCDDLGQHVAQIRLRVNTIHFASFDEGGDDRPMLTAAIGTGEEMVLAPERYLPFILPMSGKS